MNESNYKRSSYLFSQLQQYGSEAEMSSEKKLQKQIITTIINKTIFSSLYREPISYQQYIIDIRAPR